MAPKNENENSSEFTQILKELKENNKLITQVAVIESNQKNMKETQDGHHADIKNIYEKKASKADVEGVSGDLKDHEKGHFLLFLCVLGSVITGICAIIVAWPK